MKYSYETAFGERVKDLAYNVLREMGRDPETEILDIEESLTADNCTVKLRAARGVGPTVFAHDDQELMRTAFETVFRVCLERPRDNGVA